MTELQNLLDSKQAAEYLNLPGGRGAMDFMRTKRKGPKYIRLSRKCVRYKLEDLNTWIKESEVDPANFTGERDIADDFE